MHGSIRSLCHIAVLCLCFVCPGMGKAFEVKEKSLEEKVSASSLVFFGTITKLERGPLGDYAKLGGFNNERFALVRVDKLLKGSANGLVRLRYARGIAESDLSCCIVGERYLFFVSLDTLGVAESVNGRYGVYRIDDRTAAEPR